MIWILGSGFVLACVILWNILRPETDAERRDRIIDLVNRQSGY